MGFNPLSANSTKWSNTLKQFVGICRNLSNSLSVFDHFVGLALKGLNSECKIDQANFIDWMSFLPSIFMEEISTNPEAQITKPFISAQNT